MSKPLNTNPPDWIRKVADRAVDIAFNFKNAAERATEVTPSLDLEPSTQIPESGPSPSFESPGGTPIGPRLTFPSETLMSEHEEAPDSKITIRQDLHELPEDAQLMWLNNYYEGMAYQKQNPKVAEQYPVTTAWKAVNTAFQKTDIGWQRRASLKVQSQLQVITVSREGDKIRVISPGRKGEVEESLLAENEAEAREYVEEYFKDQGVKILPVPPVGVTPEEEKPRSPEEAAFGKPGLAQIPQEMPEAKVSFEPEDVKRKTEEVMSQIAVPSAESPKGEPLPSKITSEELPQVIERIKQIAEKPKSLENWNEGMRLIEDVLTSGFKFSEDDWKAIREKGFEALQKTPEELRLVTEGTPENLYDYLSRSIAVGRLISMIEDPKITPKERDQAEASLTDILSKHPEIRRQIDQTISEPQRAEQAKRQWGEWVKNEVHRLSGILEDPAIPEEAKRNARMMLGQLGVRASIERQATDFINLAKKEFTMSGHGKLEFDAKAGKYNVLHKNFLKPIVFASKPNAEAFLKTLAEETIPKVVKEGETFVVTHSDWEKPVEAKTAAEATAIVEQKLAEDSESKEEATNQAKDIVEQASKIVKKGDHELMVDPSATGGDVATETPAALGLEAPETLGSISQIAQAMGVSEDKVRTLLAQLKEEKGGEVTVEGSQDGTKVRGAETKQTSGGASKPLVSGFGKTDVNAAHGKHPQPSGLVETQSGPATDALPKIEKSPHQLHSDQAKKFDQEVQKVNRSHGLTRETQKLASTESGANLVEAFFRMANIEGSESVLAALNTLKAAKMTPEAQDWVSNKISKLQEEGKPQDQAVAQAYSMAKTEGYEVPEASK